MSTQTEEGPMGPREEEVTHRVAPLGVIGQDRNPMNTTGSSTGSEPVSSKRPTRENMQIGEVIPQIEPGKSSTQ